LVAFSPMSFNFDDIIRGNNIKPKTLQNKG